MLSVVKEEVENQRFRDEHSPFGTLASHSGHAGRSHSPIRQSRWALKLVMGEKSRFQQLTGICTGDCGRAIAFA